MERNYEEEIVTELEKRGVPAFQLSRIETKLKRFKALEDEDPYYIPTDRTQYWHLAPNNGYRTDTLMNIAQHIKDEYIEPEQATALIDIGLKSLEENVNADEVHDTLDYFSRAMRKEGASPHLSIDEIQVMAEPLRNLQKILAEKRREEIEKGNISEHTIHTSMIHQLTAANYDHDIPRFKRLIEHAVTLAKHGHDPREIFRKIRAKIPKGNEIDTKLFREYTHEPSVFETALRAEVLNLTRKPPLTDSPIKRKPEAVEDIKADLRRRLKDEE